MSFNDAKISNEQIQQTGIQSQPDIMSDSAKQNKLAFDALPTLIIQKVNSLIDQLQQQAAAGQIGVTAFEGMTATNVQQALEELHADIGGNYGGIDGAGKVGYTPSEGVDASNVQAAIEAVQANLATYIAKIKAVTGAAEVGNAPIVGMTATNVQQALEELRENIDNIVSGVIPGGSITSDMLQDGAVMSDKLGSDVTGDTIPTSASDPTTISSQLSNRLRTPVEIPAYANLNDYTTAGMFYNPGTAQAVLNIPPNMLSGSFSLLVEPNGAYGNGCKQTITDNNQGITDTRVMSDVAPGHWSEWKTLATATPPQEFDLPLAEGWSGTAKYFKTQENICVLSLSVTKNDAFEINDLISTLPADCAPAYSMSRPASAFAPHSACTVLLAEDGSIRLEDVTTLTTQRVLYANIVFLSKELTS